MKPRIFAIVTLAAMLLTSCGGSAQTEDTTASPDTTAPEETTASMFESDDLPKLDFNGKTVNWLILDYAGAYWDDMYAEDETGNRTNDAIYRARTAVEERLNVSFEYVRNTQNWDNRSQFGQTVRTSIMANDGAYDIIYGWTQIDLVMEDKNTLQNLAYNPYINFDKSYWNQSVITQMPNTDEIYMASGDGSITLTKHIFCMFFNQDQLSEFGITDNMYDVVRSGDWTFDRLKEYCKVGYRDVNGNTAADYGDEFALTFGDQNKFINIPFSSGLSTVERTDSGYKLCYGSERYVEVFDAWYDFIYNTESVLEPKLNAPNNDIAVETFGGNYADKSFIEDHAMFTQSLVGDAGVMFADAKFEYGLLPYPKHDETQEGYQTTTQSMPYFMLASYADPELSGAVIEAWASEFHRNVQPEYFEVTLKTRYAADNDMAEMYDLLRESFVWSIADTFCESLNYSTSDFKNLLAHKKEGQWMSNYAEKETAWNQTLTKMWDSLYRP